MSDPYRELLTTAREAGDASAYADICVESMGLSNAEVFCDQITELTLQELKDQAPTAREGFWEDVMSCIRNYSASDEGAE